MKDERVAASEVLKGPSPAAYSGDRAKLCPECKMVRGAIASGKLTRETVNIEGGCLTLMTSSDPSMVSKLHTMAGLSNGRAKSWTTLPR